MNEARDPIREAHAAAGRSPIDPIREALEFAPVGNGAALAALTQVEQQLAAPCRCDKCRDCVAANGYEDALARAVAAETALAEAISDGNVNADLVDEQRERAEAAERRANNLQSDLVRVAEKKDRWQRDAHDLADALREILAEELTDELAAAEFKRIARAALDRQEQP